MFCFCVWGTVLSPSPANQQMGMYSSAYLQTGPLSTHLGPCHSSLTDASGQIGHLSKHQEGRWETRVMPLIMCVDSKGHIPILPAAFMARGTSPCLFKFFKFSFRGLLDNDRSTSHFLIPANSFHNNQLSNFLSGRMHPRKKMPLSTPVPSWMLCDSR